MCGDHMMEQDVLLLESFITQITGKLSVLLPICSPQIFSRGVFLSQLTKITAMVSNNIHS